MSELKTLKDFGIEVDCSELKQEAIKRVKSCNKPVDFTRNDRCGYNKKEYCDICQREIWFNNLTEEDLTK